MHEVEGCALQNDGRGKRTASPPAKAWISGQAHPLLPAAGSSGVGVEGPRQQRCLQEADVSERAPAEGTL